MPEYDGAMGGPDQKTSSSGLKRKRIEFVPPEAPSQDKRLETASPYSLGDRYLSITLKNDAPSTSSAKETGVPNENGNHDLEIGGALKESSICKLCKMPVHTNRNGTAPTSLYHEMSLVHQICAEHSYPPSHLDRARQGLRYLSSYGWDPDSRLGLGASGNGIRNPIKAKVKHDTVGLGVKLPVGNKKAEKSVERLNAKAVRKLEMKNRKHRDKLQQMFYGNEDVEKYLSP